MIKPRLVLTDAAEAAIVNEVVVRPIRTDEDRCRLRHPVAVTVLGIPRRAVQGEARAWARRQPRARDRTCPTFLAKMSRRRGHVIRSITRSVRLWNGPAGAGPLPPEGPRARG